MSGAQGFEQQLYAMRRDEAVRVLLPLFFVSGATGLVWQTVWARELHLVFGTSTFAIATVLSAFMAGLAIGGFAAGRLADRARNPVIAYGVLEIVIGLYAAVFPLVVTALTPVYLAAAQVIGPHPVLFGMVQALLVGTALIIPTACMGATLPLLARFATDRLGSAGDRVAQLYAVNTAGALAGTALCGFVLLPFLGKAMTTYLAAGANVLLGVCALGLAAWSAGAEQATVEVDVPTEPLGARGLRVAVAMGLAGFASLVYEVAWTRLLVLTCGASVYAFTVMLLAFLAGIAFGGRLGGPLADRLFARWGTTGVLFALAATEIAVGALAYGFLWVYPYVPVVYVKLFDALNGHDDTDILVVMAALTTMIGTTVAGIAVILRLGDERTGPRIAVGSGVAVLQVGIVLLGKLLNVLLRTHPSGMEFTELWGYDDGGAFEIMPGLVYLASLGVSGLVMTPPAVLMGLAFPLAVRAITTDDKALAAPVGAVYGANTLGAVFGAALAGFVLLPTLWVRATVMLAAAVNVLAALTLLVDRDKPAATSAHTAFPSVRYGLIGVAGALLPLLSGLLFKPPWNPLWMTSGLYQYAPQLTDHSYQGLYRVSVESFDLVYYAEGLSSVVTVAMNPTTGNMWLANNGKIDASTTADMPTQVLVALLPFTYVPKADDVLVIGLASGITAGAASQVPDVKRLDVVELEPAIIEAARKYEHYNHHVLDDPRVTILPNDGRNQVLLTPPGTYDVVISEPSNPWLTGVSNLFTREFLDLGRTRLKKGGVWAQWVQMYGMGEKDLRSLLATFASVYPHVLVFTTIDDADLVILGSESEIAPDRVLSQGLLDRHSDVRDELNRVDMMDDLDLLATYVMDEDGIAAFARNEPINTDDNLRIEYSAPLHLYTSTMSQNMSELLSYGEVPRAAVRDDPRTLAKLARLYLQKDDFDRSMMAASAACAVIATTDPDPNIQALGRSLDLSRHDDWRGALTVLDAILESARIRPESDHDAIGELVWWRDDLDAWAKN